MVSPLDRLQPLLDLANDTEAVRPNPALRKAVAAFLNAFDGSETAGFIRAQRTTTDPRRADLGTAPPTAFIPPDYEDEALEWATLQRELRDLFERGFPQPPVVGAPVRQFARLEMPTLSFGVARDHLAPERVSGRERRRLVRRPGAYQLRVTGNRVDLVLYLVLHLLTLPGAVVLRRCPAPGSDEKPDPPCGRFFLSKSGVDTGRPSEHCKTEECEDRRNRLKQRAFWAKKSATERERARAKRNRRRQELYAQQARKPNGRRGKN